MKKGIIVIPSSGRSRLIGKKNLTLDYVKQSGRDYVILVPSQEFDDYCIHDNILPVDGCNSVAKAYRLAFDLARAHGYKRVCIMDDDVRLYKLRPDSRLTTIQGPECVDVFNKLFGYCGPDFPITGLAIRVWAQKFEGRLRFNNSLKGLMCLYMPELSSDFEWGYQSMFDLNYLLDNIHAGRNVLQFTHYVEDDDAGYMKNEGGCTKHRTVVGISESALALRNKFPNEVAVVNKRYNNGEQGLSTRITWGRCAPGVYGHAVPERIRGQIYKYSPFKSKENNI